MKVFVLVASLLVANFVMISCSKYKGASSDKSVSIAGTWELRKSSGGMSPGAITYHKGNGNRLKFSGDDYEIYKDNQLVKSGKYTIVQDTTVEESVCLVFAPGRFTNRIIYDNNFTTTKTFFEINGDRLTIVSGCYAVDAGSTREYEK